MSKNKVNDSISETTTYITPYLEIEALKQQVSNLEQELKDYRWKDRKEDIVNRLNLSKEQLYTYDYHTDTYTINVEREEYLIQNKMMTLISILELEDKVDYLLTHAYTYEELIEAMTEFFYGVIREHDYKSEDFEPDMIINFDNMSK
jgi:hypothetical protein